MRRPQPIGILPLPAGFLLLPDGPEEAFEQLLAGQLPDPLPAEWRVLETGHSDDLYNAFVLKPGREAWEQLELDQERQALAQLVAFHFGLVEELPETGLKREFEALECSVRASRAETEQEALALLERGIKASRDCSPLLAAQLLGNKAQLQEGPLAVQTLHQATALCEQPSEIGAELWLTLGISYQEMSDQRGPLTQAVGCYQRALQFFTREGHPDSYALAQNNLALAYLAMPMKEASDQLRMGIAVQALREVLKVYTRDKAPDSWASAQLNLANALQYLPSAHPEKNLAEAVDIYEELLQEGGQPARRARILANQANALAHLGIFEHASSKFEESRTLFQQVDDQDGVETVGQQLESLKQHQEAQLGTV